MNSESYIYILYYFEYHAFMFILLKNLKDTDYNIILGHVMYFVLYDSELCTNLANGWLFWVASSQQLAIGDVIRLVSDLSSISMRLEEE